MLLVTIGNEDTQIISDTAIRRIPVSRRLFLSAIAKLVWERYAVRINVDIAVDILNTIGSAYPLPCELGMILSVSGRRVLLTSEDVRDALRTPLGVLTETLRAMSADCVVRLTGVGSVLRGIDLLITEETGLVCHIF